LSFDDNLGLTKLPGGAEIDEKTCNIDDEREGNNFRMIAVNVCCRLLRNPLCQRGLVDQILDEASQFGIALVKFHYRILDEIPKLFVRAIELPKWKDKWKDRFP